MAQSALLHHELKRALRESRVTYKRVAEHLDLSEASVKRLFSTEGLSLRRLEQVCRLIGLEISDLVERLDARREYLTAMTPEQEEALVAAPKLLLMTYMVINGFTVDEICTSFRVSPSEAQRLLVRMDRLKIIQLLPGNRVRRLTARNFSWRKDGPVQRFFARQIQSEFFDADFGGDGEELEFVAGSLSRASLGSTLR